MKNNRFYEAYSAFCQTVTNPVRLKIIEVVNEDKLNVSQIQEKVGISMSNLSNHLGALYKLGVLDREKRGNYNYYYLVDYEIIKIISNMSSFMERVSSIKHREIS